MSDIVTTKCDSCGAERPPRDHRGRRAPGWVAVAFDALRMIDLCPDCVRPVSVDGARAIAARLTKRPSRPRRRKR